MRLLKYVDGKFEPPKDLPKDTLPRYAILSHTWGADTEEVTFQDLKEGTYTNKSGYQKLLFCEQQARRDGIQYFWVDTCCIDKSNNTELSEALNSMFRWYQNADRCYVYLSDVSTSEDSKRGGTLLDTASDLAPSEKKRDKGKQVLRKMLAFRPAGSSSKKSQPVGKTPVSPTNVEAKRPWEDAFRKSRWFTRGWTLQELLAPRSVEFFSQDGQRLGDKRSLEQQIHEITGIDIPVLQGTPLTEYTVADRFKWAESRETTKEEDGVYCLLGIFDVFLPLIPGEKKDHARQRLQREISMAEPKYKKGTKRVWTVTFEKNPAFTGRRSDLHKLRQALFVGDRTSKVALTGLGGMGKTQIALALAHETRDEKEDCSIIWIPSTTKESIGQAFRTAAQKFGIHGWNDDKADAMKLVQDHLSSETAGQWLLIIDNADDIDMWFGEDAANSQRLIDYLPKSRHGSILFTTRNKKAAVKFAPMNIFDLSVMDDTGSEDLLRNYLLKKTLLAESGNVTALLTYLNHLPLAIVQAARYINQNSIGLANYLSLLNEQEEEVIELLSEDFEDEGRYPESKNPVATTWLVSFDQIRQRDPLAAEYLSFIACIDSKDIPLSILPPNPSAKKVTDAMGTLEGYSFITKSSTGLAISIHRLVHLATRNWLRKEKQLPYWTSQATDRLGDLLCHADQTKRDIWRSYMPHAYCAIESATQTENSSDLAHLLGLYAQCLKYEGRYKEGEKIFQRQLKIRQTKLGQDHPDTLISMNNLANTYRYQGRWDEAEKLEVQVLETRRTVLGQNHPDTLGSMHNLACMYWDQGRQETALSLMKSCVEASERLLGLEHPDTVSSIERLKRWS